MNTPSTPNFLPYSIQNKEGDITNKNIDVKSTHSLLCLQSKIYAKQLNTYSVTYVMFENITKKITSKIGRQCEEICKNDKTGNRMERSCG